MIQKTAPLALLLVLACGPAAADYDPATLQARFEVLRPALEAALGEEFGDAPEFATGTEKELVAIVAKESAWFQSNVEGGPRGLGLSIQCRQTAGTLVKALLAKLDIETGRILVNPEAFQFISEIAPEFRNARGAPFLDLVILHEAVHVWQHRRFGMSKFIGQPTTVEEILCRQAVIEGHAQHVAGKAAKSVGLSAEYELLESLNSEVPSSIKDPGARLIIQSMTSFFSFQYVEGRKFVDAVLAGLGDEEGVARIFSDPPTMARQVGRPAEYLAGEESGRTLRDLAGGISKLLTEGGGSPRTVTLTKAMLLQSLSIVDAGELEKGLGEYLDGVVVLTTKGILPPKLEYIAAVMEFETLEGADRFMDLERTVDRVKNETFSEPGGMIQITDARCRELRVEGREAIFTSKKVKAGKEPVMWMRNLVVQCGVRVLELSAQGEDHSLEELQELAGKILAVLEPGE